MVLMTGALTDRMRDNKKAVSNDGLGANTPPTHTHTESGRLVTRVGVVLEVSDQTKERVALESP